MPRIRGASVTVATEKILKKIENYEFMAGDIISDLELSKEFDMSRTPIREAIMSLIDNGILERTQTKVIVKAITLTDIAEILDVREAIEQKSVEIIIANGGLTLKQKNELNSIHQQLCQNIINGDFTHNFEADDIFHTKIVEYSGNKRLLDICDRLTLQSQRLRWITMLTPSRYATTREEHSVLIEALVDNNLSAAKEAIHNHLNSTKENYRNILQMPQWSKIASEMKNMNT